MDAHGGVWASLLLGKPGFIKVSSDREIIFPDYASSNLLQITGEAEIIWNPSEVTAFSGAQRLVEVHRVREIATGNSLRWEFEDYFSFNS